MLISQAIAQANALTGQVVDNAVLVRWLSELDGRLAFEFYRADAWTPYDPTDDLSCELLVPFPWDGLYVHHLAAQTYFANGEYDRYENERVMAEKVLADFRAFMQRTQAALCGCGFPTEKSGGTGITVIPGDECHSPWFWLSAYALAVKHGFKGTEEEWLTQQEAFVQQAEDAADTSGVYAGQSAAYANNSAASAAAAQGYAEDAAESASKYPKIGTGGTWEIWDGDEYVDTGMPAQGEKGDTGDTGPQGPQGEPGEDGRDFIVLGLYATLAALQAAHPAGNAGDAYAVGTEQSNTIYLWDVDDEEWTDVGALQGPPGPQGEPGEDGPAGPNEVTASTATNLNGVLAGNGSTVTTKAVDTAPATGSANLITSGAVAQTEAELAGGMAILANGDTHVSIAKDQYVYVRNHSTLADGLYKATANIAANGTLSTSNVTAVSGGGLNALVQEVMALPLIANVSHVRYVRPDSSYTTVLSVLQYLADNNLLPVATTGSVGTPMPFIGSIGVGSVGFIVGMTYQAGSPRKYYGAIAVGFYDSNNTGFYKIMNGTVTKQGIS